MQKLFSSQGAKIPVQGLQVQNYWLVVKLTHASILLRLIKYVAGATEGFVVKSKLYPWIYSAVFRKLNPIHIKGLGLSFFI